MGRIDQNTIEELKKALGSASVATAREDLLCYSYDATGDEYLPDAVLFPENTAQVAAVMKLADKRGFPVIARGAGSGFTGGSLPIKGGAVLSTERMNKILDIDPDNMVATVEPGVVNWELQSAVEKLGLFYPPDPASLRFSTIGGNIAECAGGPRAIKYGVTRDYVLGLEAVLPTGEIINTGVKTMKGVVGFDLTRLIVGSEGTLAIVTKAYLKLLPLPKAVKTVLAVFKTASDAAKTVSAITAARVLPATLEFIDRACIEAVSKHSSAALPIGAGAVLLVEVDGDETSIESQALAVEKACMESGAVSASVAKDADEARKFWEARRSVSQSLRQIKPHKLNEDVVVPRSRIPELIEGVEKIAKERNVATACFGHAGDGNIHVNIMVDKKIPGEKERGLAAVKDVFALTLKLGGTISGEHGIGIAKAPYLAMELSPEAVAVMKGIKKVFDPQGILNPGKIFDPNAGR